MSRRGAVRRGVISWETVEYETAEYEMQQVTPELADGMGPFYLPSGGVFYHMRRSGQAVFQ